MGERIDLIENAASTSAATRWPGGKGTMTVVGTFAGATVKLQFLGADGSTWVDVDEFTIPAQKGFELAEGRIRAEVTGGAPSGLFATAVQI